MSLSIAFDLTIATKAKTFSKVLGRGDPKRRDYKMPAPFVTRLTHICLKLHLVESIVILQGFTN